MRENEGLVPASEMEGKKNAMQELEDIIMEPAKATERLKRFLRWKARWVEEGFIHSHFDVDLAKLLGERAVEQRAAEDITAAGALGQQLLLNGTGMLRDFGVVKAGESDVNFDAYVSLITATVIRAKPKEG